MIANLRTEWFKTTDFKLVLTAEEFRDHLVREEPYEILT